MAYPCIEPVNAVDVTDVNPASDVDVPPNVVDVEPIVIVLLDPNNDPSICAEPETTLIPLKNAPECIVVPFNTCALPETVPDGKFAIVCAEPDTTPDGSCALPLQTPVLVNIVAAVILPPKDVDVPAIVIAELANLVFDTEVSTN